MRTSIPRQPALRANVISVALSPTTNEDAQVDIGEVLRGLQDHAGRGLAAVAVFGELGDYAVLIMRAEVHGVEPRACLLHEQLSHPAVKRMHMLNRIIAPGSARLVGDKDGRNARIVEQAHSSRSPRVQLYEHQHR